MSRLRKALDATGGHGVWAGRGGWPGPIRPEEPEGPPRGSVEGPSRAVLGARTEVQLRAELSRELRSADVPMAVRRQVIQAAAEAWRDRQAAMGLEAGIRKALAGGGTAELLAHLARAFGPREVALAAARLGVYETAGRWYVPPGSLVKAGPYIGPRGGKWADPEHTVPWQESGGPRRVVEEHPHGKRLKLAAKVPGMEHAHDEYEVQHLPGGKVRLAQVHAGKAHPWGPTMPRESLPHFLNDLAGKVDVPPSSHPDIEAVRTGKAKVLGKGDDGVAFRAGDHVVKVSTTVPFQPDNAGHLTPEAATARLEHQTAVQNRLVEAGVPHIPRAEFHRHGDKGFQVRPHYEIPEKLTRTQLDQVHDAIEAMHKHGFALNDEIQVGVDGAGKVWLYDTGKAAPARPGGQGIFADTDRKDDRDRLKALYAQHGQEYEPRGEALAETWQRMTNPVLIQVHARQSPEKADAVRRNIRDLQTKMEAWLREKHSGRDLDLELEIVRGDGEDALRAVENAVRGARK